MESSLLYVEIMGVIVCLTVIAFFALSEAVLTATNRLRLRQLLDESEADFEPRETAQEVLRESQYVVIALVIGLYAPLLVCAFLTTHAVRQLYPRNTTAVSAVSVVAVLTILVLGHVVPKVLATRHAEFLARPARRLRALLRSAVAFGTGLSGRWLRVSDSPPTPATEENAAEEEIKSLVELGEQAGVLEAEETEIIESIFDLGKTTAREIMVPRPDVTSLAATCSVEDALRTFERSGFSRIPLYEESIDNVVGILYAKDLLESLVTGKANVRPRDLAREPLFVPETKKTDALFREMRDKKIHLAIVIDEYGGTAGLVSIEDILEELVGEILDEHDIAEEKPILTLTDGSAIVSARLDVEDFEDELNLHLPDGEFDTVGGFCLSRLGHLPTVGDTVETDNATFTIQQMRGRRVAKIKVTPKQEREQEDEEEV